MFMKTRILYLLQEYSSCFKSELIQQIYHFKNILLNSRVSLMFQETNLLVQLFLPEQVSLLNYFFSNSSNINAIVVQHFILYNNQRNIFSFLIFLDSTKLKIVT